MRSVVFDRLLNNFDGFILSLTFRSFKRFRRANLLLLEMWPFEAISKQMHFTAKPFPSMSLTSGAYLLFLCYFETDALYRKTICFNVTDQGCTFVVFVLF